MRFHHFILASLLVFSLAETALAEQRRYFADWLGACRDSGYCSATAYDNLESEVGVDADYLLRVGRHPDGIHWEISFTGVAQMVQEYSEIVVTVDDEPLAFSSAWRMSSTQGRFGAFSSINEYFFTGQPTQHLFDLMGPGANISVAFVDLNGNPQTAEFSLSGLSASLLWMDERQHRLGAERIASAPPIGLTPISDAYPVAIPRTLVERHASDPDCDPYEFLPHAHEVIQGFMNDNQRVYFLPCTSGAYNFAYKAYEGAGDTFFPLYFAQYDETTGWTGTPFLINPAYDRETRALTTYHKGRSLGDCGTTGVWQWNGSTFAMLEYRAKSSCDEQGEPGIFPVIFQSPNLDATLKHKTN